MKLDGAKPAAGRWNPFAGTSSLYRRAWWFYLLLALAALVWLRLTDPTLAAQFVARSVGRDLALGLGFGLVAVGAWQGLRRLPPARALEARLRAMVAEVSGSEIVALALLSAFAEELFFRGALQSSVGLWAGAAVFGLAHLAPGREGLLWAVWAALLGLALGSLVVYTGALTAAMAAHALINAVGLWQLARPESAADGDDSGSVQ